MEKYSGSTKGKIVINSVCNEDAGEYQAVLSFESNGPDYKSRNTIRLHVIGGILVITKKRSIFQILGRYTKYKNHCTGCKYFFI